MSRRKRETPLQTATNAIRDGNYLQDLQVVFINEIKGKLH